MSRRGSDDAAPSGRACQPSLNPAKTCGVSPLPMPSLLKFLVRSCLLLALLASTVRAEVKPPRTRATPVPDPTLAQIAETPGLPRVLLIGDSISMGYTLQVRRLLAGKANVHRPPENCFDSSRGVYRLTGWLRRARWDVVYFNFGLHDLKYLDAQGRYVGPAEGKQVTTLEAYEGNLREIARRLKRSASHVIFATTTPIPAGAVGRVEGDERRYNEVAMRVMRSEGVEVHDVCEIVRARQAEFQRPHDVHYTAAGYNFLAGEVAAAIERNLPAH
jgi:acyl-CoA thioesterase-1